MGLIDGQSLVTLQHRLGDSFPREIPRDPFPASVPHRPQGDRPVGYGLLKGPRDIIDRRINPPTALIFHESPPGGTRCRDYRKT